MDFPVRGIIRGWWEIGDYEFNLSIPQQVFAGPEITFATPAEIRSYPWAGKITDSLPPDVLMTVDPDIQKVQAEARALVRETALERVQVARLSARSASDFIRFNRVEGLSIGAGSTERIGSRVFLTNRARFGFDDHQLKGSAELHVGNLGVFVRRDFAEIGDVQERSGAFNSLSAQEFGSDLSDPFDRTSIGVGGSGDLASGWHVALSGSRVIDRQLSVHAVPASGAFLPPALISPLRGLRASVDLDRAARAFLGGEFRVGGGISVLEAGDQTWSRVHVSADQRYVIGASRVNLSAFTASQLGNSAPLQELVYFGGPISLPGYALHDVAGSNGVAGRAEAVLPVPFIPIPLGRFGSIPAQAHLVPFVAGAYVHGFPACTAAIGRGPTKTNGFYPAAGMGLLTFFDLLRLDVARGLRDGRWMFNIDVSRDFWSIL
ncbi:MAG TPA: hypothetical protein VFP77_06935, partial [Gemmatimonadaceae bacterium]|nr:hypothetical protein [Gemmatimonadaceae bacterium]